VKSYVLQAYGERSQLEGRNGAFAGTPDLQRAGDWQVQRFCGPAIDDRVKAAGIEIEPQFLRFN
jgi:hypothetical protein